MENTTNLRNRAWLLIIITLMTTTASLSGCHPRQSSDNEVEIISKELLKVPGQNPNINIYKIFYYSDNIKVEALLTVPKARGKYPLMVMLHGGYTTEHKEITHEKFGITPNKIIYKSDEVIGLYPQYRGYLESDGHVQGIAENTVDTQNAIKVAMSIGNVKPNSVYLFGISMGGGVALRTASERQDVKAVVGLSPFVGWDVNIRWMFEHPDAEVVNGSRRYAEYVKFGIINVNPELEGDYSILDRIPDIHAPVLLLQGTGDDSVQWEAVQDFANEMEEAGKTVKLVLYPNGSHALEDRYQSERSQEIMQWFQKYGVPKSFEVK